MIDTIEFGGGAERQMTYLAKLLGEKGYNVELVSYYQSDSTYFQDNEKPNVNLVSLQVKNNKFSKLMAIKKYIKSLDKCDCVIAYKDGPCIIGCLLKLIGLKIKLIVSERSSNRNITLKERFKFLLYGFADYVVPNSYNQESFIRQNFLKLNKKLTTITNAIDTSHFYPTNTSINSKIKILTVARIVPEKNILNYLEAIKMLKQNGFAEKVHFDWYGDTIPNELLYKESCFNKRKTLEIEDMIEFHGATKDVVQYYQTCDIFCLPSVLEGFPNVICEAMSCGKPIVAGRICDNPYIIQENNNGLLFNPNDINSIYSTLKQIIEMSRTELFEWGENSRVIAEAMFSKDTFVHKYIELIES